MVTIWVISTVVIGLISAMNLQVSLQTLLGGLRSRAAGPSDADKASGGAWQGAAVRASGSGFSVRNRVWGSGFGV